MRAKGTRLWWRKPRYDGAGKVSHPGVWLILDGGRSISTGTADRKEAERALAQHINQSWRPSPQDSAANVKIADVLTYYARERARSWADPKRAAVQLRELNEWWGSRKLSTYRRITRRAKDGSPAPKWLDSCGIVGDIRKTRQDACATPGDMLRASFSLRSTRDGDRARSRTPS